MHRRIQKYIQHIGLDRAVIFTILARGLTIATGLATILFITKFLTPELQGYYYTFYSLIALQIFIELGLGVAIVQFASHEMARLNWSAGILVGDSEAKQRLKSLTYFSAIWLSLGALAMIILLLAIGLIFLKKTAHGAVFIEAKILWPWTFLVIFSAFNLVVTAGVVLIEGLGEVTEVALLRVCQSVVSAISIWAVLFFGGQLYALAAGCIAATSLALAWIWLRYRVFFLDLIQYKNVDKGINWRDEIWPFQWRIAVSWISGYLAFQLFNPIILSTHGPVEAGRMGLTMQIFNSLNAGALAWISTKVPTYGKLIAQNRRTELDRIFFKGVFQSFVILIIAIFFLIAIVFYLEKIQSNFSFRVLPVGLIVILAVASLSNHIIFAEASYLRAHKEEPFMGMSVLNGISTLILSLLLIPPYGADGAVFAYAIATVFIGLALGTIIFSKERKRLAGNS